MPVSSHARPLPFVAGAVTCALAMLVSACTSEVVLTRVGRATAVVHAGSATTLMSAGVTVTLPDGAAADGATAILTIGGGEGLPQLPEGMSQLGPIASVDLAGGIVKPATVTFPAPPGIMDQSIVPVIVWQDGTGGWRWVPTTYDADRRTVSAGVDHFSFGFLSGIDVKKWASDRWQSFRTYITGRSGLGQPRCGNEAAARAGGVQVTSDSGDRVKWCFGVDGGRRILKVANNTRMYQQITFPATWRVVGGGSVSFDASMVARAIGAAVPLPRGMVARVVDGGDTLTLEVPTGASGRVTTETSVVAWLISAITFGIETYAAVAKAAGSTLEKAAKGAVDRFAVLLGATSQAASGFEVLKGCLGDASGLVRLDRNDGWDVLKFAWKCVPAYMESQIKDVQIFAAGVILSMIGTGVGAILTGVHLLVTGVRDLWDDMASLGGRGDPIYDIVITGSSAYPPSGGGGQAGGGSTGGGSDPSQSVKSLYVEFRNVTDYCPLQGGRINIHSDPGRYLGPPVTVSLLFNGEPPIAPPGYNPNGFAPQETIDPKGRVGSVSVGYALPFPTDPVTVSVVAAGVVIASHMYQHVCG